LRADWGLRATGKGALRIRPFGPVYLAAVKSLFATNAAEWSAAIAYYLLLSAFPLLLVTSAAAALVVDPALAAQRATTILGQFLPQGGGQVERIVQGAVASRGRIGLISIPALLWTGGRAFASLTLALNALRGDDTPEDAPRRFLVSLAMLAGIGLSFFGALVSGVVIDEVWRLVQPLPGDPGPVFIVVRIVARAITAFVAFSLVYWFVPRGRQDRRATLIGAGTATVLFMAARPLFLLIIERSATYQVTYGPLALAAILMVWAWVVAFITLFGGQVSRLSRSMLFEPEPAARGEAAP